jgi:COP9 signalosome complex subunit 3
MPTLPKVVSAATTRTYKSLARPYEAFALAFRASDALFRQEIESTRETFSQDGNLGLATQCVHAFQRMQIVALRDTYVTLGVGEIAQKKFDVARPADETEGPDEIERVILGMVRNEICRLVVRWRSNNHAFLQIERAEISASLSQSGPDPSASQTTVHFDSSPVEEARNLALLEEQIQRIVALNEQVKQMDRKLGLTKEYIQFTTRQGKAPGGGGPVGLSMDSDMMELEYGAVWGDDDPDETIMQDIGDDAI